MGVIEMLRPRERAKVDFRREFAWLPLLTADAGTVWLVPVWAIRVNGGPPVFSRDTLPLHTGDWS